MTVLSALVIQVPPGTSPLVEPPGGKPAIQRIPPHITLLYPFAPPKQLNTVLPALERVCAQVDPFRLTLNRYGRFETTLFLEPDDPSALLNLFRRLSAAFPKYPPYGGAFGPNLRPHLTLAEYKDPGELETLNLPPPPSLTFIVDRLHIFTGDPDRLGSWRSRAVIPLGMASSQSQRVRRMFARIARRYDLMNRLMTFGRDVSWRREVIRRAALRRGSWLLDVGSGPGDLAFAALRQTRGAHITCVDFTPEMMELGRQRPGAERLAWTTADAQSLPFSSQTFDAVVSGFLLRNVDDLDLALAEQVRVLKPGGRFVALDTTPPSKGPFRPLLRFHLHRAIPALGLLVTGDAEAYNYLPDSTERFLAPEECTEKMRAAGLQDVGFTRKMLGTVAIYWGRSSTG